MPQSVQTQALDFRSRPRAMSSEIAVRRADALRLRFSGLTEEQIGEALGVSASTICRDLDALHEEVGTQLRARESMVREVADALVLYQALEGAAFRELVRLESVPDAPTSAKIKAIAAVHGMRKARLDLLANVGVLGSTLPQPTAVSDASALWARLRAEGILDEMDRATAPCRQCGASVDER